MIRDRVPAGLAVQELSAAIRDGHDLRYCENVLLAVNHDKHERRGAGSAMQPEPQRGQELVGTASWARSSTTIRSSAPAGPSRSSAAAAAASA